MIYQGQTTKWPSWRTHLGNSWASWKNRLYNCSIPSTSGNIVTDGGQDILLARPAASQSGKFIVGERQWFTTDTPNFIIVIPYWFIFTGFPVIEFQTCVDKQWYGERWGKMIVELTNRLCRIDKDRPQDRPRTLSTKKIVALVRRPKFGPEVAAQKEIVKTVCHA